MIGNSDPRWSRSLIEAGTPERQFTLGETTGIAGDPADLIARKRRWREDYRARNRGGERRRGLLMGVLLVVFVGPLVLLAVVLLGQLVGLWG